MELKIHDLNCLIEKDLTPSQMGLIFFILLLKEKDPKMTLAKFKTKVKIKDHRKDLIELQDKGIISWSGYKSAKKSLESEINMVPIAEILDFMNNLYGRNFKKTDSTVTAIQNRLLEYSIDEIKLVIANRHEEWKDNKTMSRHLQPSTVFRKSNFDKYYEEAKDTGIGKNITTINALNLSKGDVLNTDVLKDLNDSSLYSIKVYKMNKHNSRIGSGMPQNLYGEALKRLITKENRKQKHDGYREFEYVINQ